MFKDVLILGSGSAGLMAALAIKRQLPDVNVRVLRSKDIGVIGVGESTTPNVPKFLFEYLGLSRRQFYALAQPTWKLGIHFLWGPRESFEYPFMTQLDVRWRELARPNGYYCDDDFSCINVESALMSEGKAFARREDGTPQFNEGHAFHLENVKYVKLLETAANSLEIEFIDGVMTGAKRGPQGISEIVLEDSRTLTADFFIDASGFRRELIGKTLNEPFIGYENSLFNDRAVLGSWQIEPGEVILPYTTAETMNSGWAWRIDHQDSVNRGYVYSSAHISDEEAQAEFAAKNPRAKLWNKVIKFRTGRFERCWVENVLGLGNAYAFVEPLESTALMAVCTQCMMFCDLVKLAGPSEQVRAVYNRSIGNYWDEIRSFLTLHFKLNTRLNTPYWIRCQQEADTPQLRPIVEFYQDVGPSGFNRYNLVNHESAFGMEGYLVQFVGNRFPYRNRHVPTDAEARFVKQMREKNLATAKKGLTANEAMAIIKHPNWRWTEELPRATGKTG